MGRIARAIVLTIVVGGSLVPGPALAARRCGDDTATVVGDSGNNVLRGTPGRDVIWAGGGNDRINSRGGNDRICAGAGNDRVDAGGGEDALSGEGGADVLRGGPGPDSLFGGGGKDRQFGDAGLDSFGADFDEGDDAFFGGAGDFDYLHYGSAKGPVSVDLGGGTASGPGFGNDSIAVGSIETVYGSQHSDEIIGDEFDNELFGGFESSGDVIRGAGGNDYLEGYESGDELYGDAGDDELAGGFGSDTLDGGEGSDTASYRGEFSSSTCVPDPCNVRADLRSQTGVQDSGFREDVDAFTSIENLEGSQEDGDVLIGDAGDNILMGGSGGDQLEGGLGNDVMFGQAGPDVLAGDDGDDTIYGDDPALPSYEKPGDDDLDGGTGTDLLDGGPRDDTCSNGEEVRDCETVP